MCAHTMYTNKASWQIAQHDLSTCVCVCVCVPNLFGAGVEFVATVPNDTLFLFLGPDLPVCILYPQSQRVSE